MRTKKAASRTTMSFAVALLVAALSAGDAWSQEPPKKPRDAVAARVAQAQLAEQTERDFTRAEQLWRALAEDATVDAEQRGQAWLAVARNLQRLGKAEEAKQALDAAEALGGKAGEEAKRLRNYGGRDERVVERAKAAVAALVQLLRVQQGEVDFRKPPCSDVLWLGEASVPELATAIDASLDSSHIVSGCVRALVQIGGEQAAEVVARLAASGDVLLRRSLVEGLGDGKGREPVRSVAMKLVDDPDARVRLFALQNLMSVMTREELLAQAMRPNGMLREEGLRRARKLEEGEAGFEARGYSDELVAVLQRALDDPSLDVRKTVADALGQRALFITAAGRELYLAALASDAMRDDGISTSIWQMRVRQAAPEWFRPSPTAERLVEVARVALDPARRAEQAREEAKTGLSAYMEYSCTALATDAATGRGADPWPDDHATLLEFGRIGGWGVIQGWARKCARIEDLPAIVAIAVEHDATALGVIELLAPHVRELPVASQKACIDPLVRRGEQKTGARVDDQFVFALTPFSIPDAERAVVSAIRERPEHYDGLVNYLLAPRRSLPGRETLVELLVLPGASPSKGVQPNADPPGSQLRAKIVRVLAEAQAPELPERLAAAYRAGLPEGGNDNALRYLFVDSTTPEPKQGWWSWAPRYPTDVLARALRDCADADVPVFWSHLWNLVEMQLDPSRRADPSRDEVSRAVASFLPRIAQASIDPRTRREIAQNFVEQRCAGWEEFAVAAFDDLEVSQAILDGLQSMPPALLPKVLAKAEKLSEPGLGRVPWYVAVSDDPPTREQLFSLLRHPSSSLRVSAVAAIAEHAPARLVECVEPLVKDRTSKVRSTVARTLRTSFDRAAIPMLIELLRDSEEQVQKAARESLDQLQYYFDSKLRWERLLSESGIDANNAAEALLKQARGGATIEVRKAAIDSLGTLKVPEALPFLIELMADPDPTLSAAARAAITKING